MYWCYEASSCSVSVTVKGSQTPLASVSRLSCAHLAEQGCDRSALAAAGDLFDARSFPEHEERRTATRGPSPQGEWKASKPAVAGLCGAREITAARSQR